MQKDRLHLPKESGYRGYNTVWQDQSGNKFELQYHTKESVRIKEEIHKDYEAFRIENNPEKSEALLQKMESAWSNFTPPNNYKELPGVMKA
jgi:hypothetical protein